jgi:hypothetical protein
MRRQDRGKGGGISGWVNTDVAAEALGVSSRSVRNYILNGDLVARKEAEGINERYLVSVDSLYSLRDRRKQAGKLPGNRRSSSRTEEPAELVRETAVDMLRETLASLETHIAQNAELRARLELTERAESTLREELERERQLRSEEVRRERAERMEAQESAKQLEQERSPSLRPSTGGLRKRENVSRWSLRLRGRKDSGAVCLEGSHECARTPQNLLRRPRRPPSLPRETGGGAQEATDRQEERRGWFRRFFGL